MGAGPLMTHQSLGNLANLKSPRRAPYRVGARCFCSGHSSPHSFVQQLPLRTIVDLVYQQAEGSFPQGTPLSPATLARYIREIAQHGTRQSIPYRWVYTAIRNYELFID
ncbi:BTB/POZ domain-containing protein NPY2 [Bienertia sinuspersici]